MVQVKFKRLPNGEGLPLPTYQTSGAAGLDICAASAVRLTGGRASVVPTGFAIEIPHGYEVQVRSRSGMASKQGVFVVNSPGTIDSDYRGEVGVILATTNPNDVVHIKRGDRIAQLVVAPVTHVEVTEVEELTSTRRGLGGFGSTGS